MLICLVDLCSIKCNAIAIKDNDVQENLTKNQREYLKKKKFLLQQEKKKNGVYKKNCNLLLQSWTKLM